MKISRYLVAGLGAAVVCAFVVFAGGQQTPASSEERVLAKDTQSEAPYLTSRQAQMRQVLETDASIVPWLLEQAATGDEQERASAFDALNTLAPIAASDVMKGLGHQNPAIRQTAMSMLPDFAAYPNFPLNEALAVLLKIVHNENEDDAYRKQARMTVYQIIGVSQGVSIRLPSRPPA